ncbi:MAG: hypothetical protein ACTHU0_04700 [Kofleriaceae bacterium]
MSNPPGLRAVDRNVLGHLARTLAELGSDERQILYKQSVPFVHVPAELAQQCYTYRDYLDRSWFRNLFAAEEATALRSFFWAVREYGRAHLREWLDVDQGILDDPAWRAIMARAKELYEGMVASGRLDPDELTAAASVGRARRGGRHRGS